MDKRVFSGWSEIHFVFLDLKFGLCSTACLKKTPKTHVCTYLYVCVYIYTHSIYIYMHTV